MYDVWKRPARLVRNVGVFLFFFFLVKSAKMKPVLLVVIAYRLLGVPRVSLCPHGREKKKIIDGIKVHMVRPLL